MSVKIKFFLFGFITACSVGVGSVVAFLFLYQTNNTMIFHDQVLPSGKHIKVTAHHLAWGIDHDDRYANEDCMTLEYVFSQSDADQHARDQETVEVFELIRPISEQWGFKKAAVVGFPTAKRKGTYYIYSFARNADGKWTFTQQSMKVHIDD